MAFCVRIKNGRFVNRPYGISISFAQTLPRAVGDGAHDIPQKMISSVRTKTGDQGSPLRYINIICVNPTTGGKGWRPRHPAKNYKICTNNIRLPCVKGAPDGVGGGIGFIALSGISLRKCHIGRGFGLCKQKGGHYPPCNIK